MEDFLGYLIAICIIFFLNSIETLEKRDIVTITCVGWLVYIFSRKEF